jgi:hypothetical protein
MGGGRRARAGPGRGGLDRLAFGSSRSGSSRRRAQRSVRASRFGFPWRVAVLLRRPPILEVGFPWISLDFLGFSRPNRDLSMGYATFSCKPFSSRLCCREGVVGTARVCCNWVDSVTLAHPPSLVGAGRGGGSRGPTRLANVPLHASPIRRRDPPPLSSPTRGEEAQRCDPARKLKSRRREPTIWHGEGTDCSRRKLSSISDFLQEIAHPSGSFLAGYWTVSGTASATLRDNAIKTGSQCAR